MKRLFALLFTGLFFAAAAQESDRRFHYYTDERAVIRRDSLYGFIDRSGREVIPCRYDKAYNFNDGRAMVRSGREVYAIDTAGRRLACKVRIPKFRGREFESFVYWVWRRIPIASTDELRRLRDTEVNVVVTIGRDGRITACEKADDSSDELFERVRRVVLSSPEWTPGEVDGVPCEIRYLLPVEFGHMRTPPCHAVDEAGKPLGCDFVYPLFRGGWYYHFYDWFFQNLRFRDALEYQRAAPGTVRAAFTVDPKGAVREIEILSSHNDVCRDKVVSLLKKSLRWTPGTSDGRPIGVRYELAFYFNFR
ncbi:energy transducer TonB [Alistipes sp.]|uniref:energy transducer TonB n=1 Tax=Alistipes sp. TaxID=1872444 RepID=UPI003AF08021